MASWAVLIWLLWKLQALAAGPPARSCKAGHRHARCMPILLLEEAGKQGGYLLLRHALCLQHSFFSPARHALRLCPASPYVINS